VSKRRTDDEVTRLLKDADRDLAKGLTVSDFCRKVGVAPTTYHRWRKRHDPAQVEVERLKRLVAELLLDKQMLQDVAKKKW
jgi:putative transposase